MDEIDIHHERISCALDGYNYLYRSSQGNTVSWHTFDPHSSTGKKLVTSYDLSSQDLIEFDNWINESYPTRTGADLKNDITFMRHYTKSLDNAFSRYGQIYRDVNNRVERENSYIDRRISYYVLDKNEPDGKLHLFDIDIDNHEHPKKAVDAQVLRSYNIRGMVDLDRAFTENGLEVELSDETIRELENTFENVRRLYRVDRLIEATPDVEDLLDLPFGTKLESIYYSFDDSVKGCRAPLYLLRADTEAKENAIAQYIDSHFEVQTEDELDHLVTAYLANHNQYILDQVAKKEGVVYTSIQRGTHMMIDEDYPHNNEIRFSVIDPLCTGDERKIGKFSVPSHLTDFFLKTISANGEIPVKSHHAFMMAADTLVDDHPRWQDREFVSNLLKDKTGDRLRHASDEIKGDKQFILEHLAHYKATQTYSVALFHNIAPHLFDDKEFLVDVVAIDEHLLTFASAINDNEDYLIKALERNPNIHASDMSERLEQEIGSNDPLKFLKARKLYEKLQPEIESRYARAQEEDEPELPRGMKI